MATDQSIGNNQYFGLGDASADFTRNTVLIAEDATIIGFVFSIRSETLGETDTVSAEIVRSTTCGDELIETGVIATVTGPTEEGDRSCCTYTAAFYDVLSCDLLSIRVTRTGKTEALQEGAAATIILRSPII